MHLSKEFLRVLSIELVIIISVGSQWKPSEYVYQMEVEGMTSNTVVGDLFEVIVQRCHSLSIISAKSSVYGIFEML